MSMNCFTNTFIPFLTFFDEFGIGQTKGLFSIDHLIFTVLAILTVALLLIFTHKMTDEKIEKMTKILFFAVTILEILKIIWNVTLRTDKSPNNWVPLYFCSLFIYALGMVSFGKGKIKEIGVLWIVYGQIIGALAFILYPSSSLEIQPLIHVLSIHSWIYHVISLYIGLLFIITNYYKTYDSKEHNETLRHNFLYYFVSIMAVELLVYIFNLICNTNLMFLNEPGVVPILELVVRVFGYFYPLIIAIVQASGTFLGGFLFVKLINLIKKKRMKDGN